MTSGVNLNVMDLYVGFAPFGDGVAPASTEYCPDPCDKDLGAKGFGDIVVGSDLQTGYYVGFVAFCGHHQNRHVLRSLCCTDPGTDLNTVHPGKHEVEYEEIRNMPFR